MSDLENTLPAGISVLDARVVLGKRASLNASLNRAVYTLPVSFWENTDELEESIEKMLAAPILEVERQTKESSKSVDIRPALFEADVDDDKIVMTLGIGESGYARATEVGGLLADGSSCPAEALPYHRSDLYRVDHNGERVDAMDL